MKNATLTFQSASRDQPGTVLLTGDLMLTNAELIRQQLLPFLHQPGGLLIQVAEVTALDVAFVQLLYALRLSARELDKTIAWQMNLTDEQHLLMARAGFNEFTQVIQ
jgi:anti-anti-sigma regulatory factor